MRQMANQPAVGSVAPYLDATAMGPVHPVDATDLYGAGAAPNDVRYELSPCERDAWQAGWVDQAGPVMGQMTGPDPHTAASGPFDGPYDAATVQPGVPLYGMAGG